MTQPPTAKSFAAGALATKALRRGRRWLRLPKIIMGEIGVITLACVISTLIPQTPTATSVEVLRFSHAWPLTSNIATRLHLDQVLWAPWFLVACLAAAGSLSLVLVEHLRRLERAWRHTPTESSFRGAPLNREFTRPSRQRSGTVITQEGRWGWVGSPLFHLGLLLCMAGGLGRALWGSDAVVDVVQGEILPPQASAWGGQWGGPWSTPIALPAAARFDDLQLSYHASGDVAAESATLEVGGLKAPLQVNAPLHIGDLTVYLTLEHGPAALLVVGDPKRDKAIAVLAREESVKEVSYDGTQGGVELHLRATQPKDHSLPRGFEARVLIDSGLRYAGPLGLGQGVALGGDRAVILREIRPWARLRASRDPSLPLVWMGLLFATLGAACMVVFVPVDLLVQVEDAGAEEHVRVAMRPARYAPLHADRFEALVRAEGASPP